MQKIYLLVIVLVILISCQREISIEPSPDKVTGDSGIIVKKIDEFTEAGYAGKAIHTTRYEYNAEKKLIRTTYIALNGGDSTWSESIYKRFKNKWIRYQHDCCI